MLSIKHLILVDPKEDVIEALREEFADEKRVTCVVGRFESLQTFDCMVSAANSFGLMDGGVDLAITKFFGFELMDRVQERIVSDWFGEQPVGTSFIEATGHPKHPYVAHSPTMRVPTSIVDTANVYEAMFATLRAVELFNREGYRIRTLACPGLGTLTGRMSPVVAARQMALAFRSADQPLTRINWEVARDRHYCVEGARRTPGDVPPRSLS